MRSRRRSHTTQETLKVSPSGDDPDEPEYVAILRKIAPPKQFNRATIETRIRRLIKDYVEEERLVWDKAPLDRDGIKPIAEGKAHIRATIKSTKKLRSQIALMRERNHSDLLWFMGSAIEALPDVRAELDRRNSEIWKMVGQDEDQFAVELTNGVELLSEILGATTVELDRLQIFFDKILKHRARRRPSPPHGFDRGRLKALVKGLGQLYLAVTQKKPAAGTQGSNHRKNAPFVRFVRAVLHAHGLKEAKRKALGQTVYGFIREQRMLDELVG